MKMSWMSLITILTLSCLFSPRSYAELPRRALELELEAVTGVSGYEIQVIRILENNKRKPPVLFKIKTTTWRAKLVPGRYELRVRSLDSREVPGEWSESQDFIVKLPPATLTKPSTDEVVMSDQTEKEKVNFQWQPVEGAEKYKLRILDSKGSMVLETMEKDSSVRVELPVGKTYSWILIPVMPGDLEGEANEPANPFQLHGGKLKPPKIGAVDDTNTEDCEWAEHSRADEFSIKLEKRDLKGNWIAHYEANKISGTKHKTDKILPTGKYRVLLSCVSKMWQESEFSMKEFSTRDLGTRAPAAIEQIKAEASYDSKSRIFAVASYYFSSIDFSSKNADVGNETKFNAISGTGRLGVGTWFGDDSKWGALLTADLSGIQIANSGSTQTSTYASAAILGVYRMRLESIGQLRFYMGLDYKELPETVKKPGSQIQIVQRKITTAGPSLGVGFYHGFSQNIGIQFNLGLRHSTLGLSTPESARSALGISPNGGNNGATDSSGHGSNIGRVSYQGGVLGSLKLKTGLVGFLGYVYRVENAAYTTTSGSRGIGDNSVSLTGHYLNLMLEYGF